MPMLEEKIKTEFSHPFVSVNSLQHASFFQMKDEDDGTKKVLCWLVHFSVCTLYVLLNRPIMTVYETFSNLLLK